VNKLVFSTLLLLATNAVADEKYCWGEYDPTVKTECEYELLSEEDVQIEKYIRENLTAWWTRKND
jgi:hypothetical protein